MITVVKHRQKKNFENNFSRKKFNLKIKNSFFQSINPSKRPNDETKTQRSIQKNNFEAVYK